MKALTGVVHIKSVCILHNRTPHIHGHQCFYPLVGGLALCGGCGLRLVPESCLVIDNLPVSGTRTGAAHRRPTEAAGMSM